MKIELNQQHIVVAAVATSLLVLAFMIGSPGAAEARGCGLASASNGHGSYSSFRVTTKNLGCAKGKSVIRRAWRSGKMMSPGSRVRVGAFTCRQMSYYEWPKLAIRCANGNRLAKAYWTVENEG